MKISLCLPAQIKLSSKPSDSSMYMIPLGWWFAFPNQIHLFILSGYLLTYQRVYDIGRKVEMGMLFSEHQGSIEVLKLYGQTHMLSGGDDGKLSTSNSYNCCKEVRISILVGVVWWELQLWLYLRGIVGWSPLIVLDSNYSVPDIDFLFSFNYSTGLICIWSVKQWQLMKRMKGHK